MAMDNIYVQRTLMSRKVVSELETLGSLLHRLEDLVIRAGQLPVLEDVKRSGASQEPSQLCSTHP